jgi:hypothetical protein
MFAKSAQTPFIPIVVLLAIIISHEFLILFIETIIGQVHVPVVFIYLLSVSLRGKSSQAFLMNVDS